MFSNKYGSKNAAMTCPHCQVKGKIRTMKVKQKKGSAEAKLQPQSLRLDYLYLQLDYREKKKLLKPTATTVIILGSFS